MTESGIAAITKELQSSTLTEELILDTLDGFNPVLNSNVARENLTTFDKYSVSVVDLLGSTKIWLGNIFDELHGGILIERISDVFTALTGNKLQEEENRREMLDVLANIGQGNSTGNIPSPLPSNGSDSGITSPISAGISAGITQVVASKIAAFIPQSVTSMFLPLTAFFSNFLRFGKMLIRFAGPIAIAISVITSLIGAITGGIAGYKEGGVEGAIKGALIGAIDGLIGSIVKGLADVAGWLLKAIGLKEIGSALGPAVKGIFDGIYQNIKGIVDVVTGIFTLDSDKVIGGLKSIFTAFVKIWSNFGHLLLVGIKELVPLIWKTIKFTLWDLPKFLGEMIMKGLDFLWNDFPGLFSKAMTNIGTFIDELLNKISTDLFPFLAQTFIGVLDSLSVVLTQLLGGLFDWLGGLLNWETISNGLGGAVNLIERIGKTVWDFIESIGKSITDLFQTPGEALSNTWGSMIDFRDKLYKKILSQILPQRSGDTSWSDPMHWVSKAIPDSVYQFAGLPTEAGNGLNDTTGGVNPFEQKDRATKAGYSSWDDYKNSGWKWKGPSIESAPSNAGAMLNEATGTLNNAPVIINNMGGNVTNTNTSQVNNNTSPFEPIMAGSSMGFVSL